MNKQYLKTALHMFIGALLLTICAIIIWAITNFDVLYKAYRFPEVIRAMNIEVQVSE